MIILTAGHTGPNTGAQCATTQFDEGAETIWLRNRVAEILTNKYGLVVLMDDDRASLKLLTKALSEDLSHTEDILHTEPEVLSLGEKCTENTEDAVASPASKSVQIRRAKIANKRGQRSFLQLPSRSNFNEVKSCEARERIEEKEDLKSELSVQSVGENSNPDGTRSVKSVSSVSSVREKENSVRSDDFVIDLHFNAHSNPNARGTETIVADDATKLELRFASRLAHTTSDALDIPLRCIKSESQTPHRRLAMLHLTPQSIILEVCFCTSPEDVEAYRNNREKLAGELAWAIAELLPSVVSTVNRL